MARTNDPWNNKSCHAADRVPRRETFPFVTLVDRYRADSETHDRSFISFIAGTSITRKLTKQGMTMTRFDETNRSIRSFLQVLFAGHIAHPDTHEPANASTR